jgi:hypothetical protein
MSGIYTLGPIREIDPDKPDGKPLFGFVVIGVLGHPLTGYAWESREEAENTRSAMRVFIETAKKIEVNFARR